MDTSIIAYIIGGLLIWAVILHEIIRLATKKIVKQNEEIKVILNSISNSIFQSLKKD